MPVRRAAHGNSGGFSVILMKSNRLGAAANGDAQTRAVGNPTQDDFRLFNKASQQRTK
jgi:hypothetical protein